VTPTATPTSTPSAGKTPAASPTPAPVVTDTNSLDFFTDIKGHWAAEFFADLLRREIVNGYPTEL